MPFPSVELRSPSWNGTAASLILIDALSHLDRRATWHPGLGAVSIHAPARERRDAGCWCVCAARFNPRPREGATPGRRRVGRLGGVSTHAPARERPNSPCFTPTSTSFNPRPREGATTYAARRLPRQPVSTHAPARERPPRPSRSASSTVFQPTPPRGSDQSSLGEVEPNNRFNPRPREGATRRRAARDGRRAVSTHACQSASKVDPLSAFNIAPPCCNLRG